MTVTMIFRVLRGPSNSHKKIFCQVESPIFPSTMGMVSWGPTIPAFKCESPLLSWWSCSQIPAYTSLLNSVTTSLCTESSQFSWIMILFFYVYPLLATHYCIYRYTHIDKSRVRWYSRWGGKDFKGIQKRRIMLVCFPGIEWILRLPPCIWMI